MKEKENLSRKKEQDDVKSWRLYHKFLVNKYSCRSKKISLERKGVDITLAIKKTENKQENSVGDWSLLSIKNNCIINILLNAYFAEKF